MTLMSFRGLLGRGFSGETQRPRRVALWRRSAVFGVIAAALALTAPTFEAKGQAALDPENTLFITVGLDYPSATPDAQPTRSGVVTIRLRPDLAPEHVERVKTLAREQFYDNVVFHRVIEGFMAQTGDPTGTGAGGSSRPDLPAEFTNEEFRRGVVGMARSADPNSGNSQFFIMFARAASLDGQYTVFGEVVDGMSIVDEIKRGPTNANGIVGQPRDRMMSVRVAADN